MAAMFKMERIKIRLLIIIRHIQKPLPGNFQPNQRKSFINRHLWRKKKKWQKVIWPLMTQDTFLIPIFSQIEASHFESEII